MHLLKKYTKIQFDSCLIQLNFLQQLISKTKFFWKCVPPLKHNILCFSPSQNISSSLFLWIVSQKWFMLRMKLIHCEIISPVLHLREAHRGHWWFWASRLCSISAYCSVGSVVHTSAWQNMPFHPSNNTTQLHLLYSCYIQTI